MLARDLLYCMEQKHGHWQTDWLMFYANVIAGSLAVRWQRCVELNIDLSVKSWGGEDWDGLDKWEGQRGCVGWGGEVESTHWRIWTCWEWRSMWHTTDTCGKQSLPIQPHPRWKNMIVKQKCWFVLERVGSVAYLIFSSCPVVGISTSYHRCVPFINILGFYCFQNSLFQCRATNWYNYNNCYYFYFITK